MAIYHSFKEFAAAQGIKVKEIKEPTRKCPKCGDPMRHVGNTNVYMCDHVDFKDEELHGESVQVFTRCKTVVFA